MSEFYTIDALDRRAGVKVKTVCYHLHPGEVARALSDIQIESAVEVAEGDYAPPGGTAVPGVDSNVP